MSCALCLREKKLCKSHIIPQFFYEPLYENGQPRKFFQISGDPVKKTISRQQGIWEYLLCEDCEAQFSGLEDYGRRIIFGGCEIRVSQRPDGFLIHDIDYAKFKLFQMSILWRADASTRREFSNVNLGPHRERLRDMISRNDPGMCYQYGCMIVASPLLKRERINMIMPLGTVKCESHHLHRFLLNYTLWGFFVSNHMHQLKNLKMFLSEDGTLPVVYDRDRVRRLLGGFARDLREAGKITSSGEVC